MIIFIHQKGRKKHIKISSNENNLNYNNAEHADTH